VTFFVPGDFSDGPGTSSRFQPLSLNEQKEIRFARAAVCPVVSCLDTGVCRFHGDGFTSGRSGVEWAAVYI
jgi:hypothetical protein